MIVYAESNFVLELTFLRKDHEDAERLLALSEAGAITLAVPAYSLAEPYETLTRRAKTRRTLQAQLATEIGELARSQPYAELAETSRTVTSVLAASAEEERLRLGAVVERVIRGAGVIPLTGATMSASLQLQASLGFATAQDAIVYASVEEHLATAPDLPRLFVTQNRKDFLTPDVQTRLNRLDCRLFTSFPAARGFVESTLGNRG
jgi:predicted nucleic acid-binding protein